MKIKSTLLCIAVTFCLTFLNFGLANAQSDCPDCDILRSAKAALSSDIYETSDVTAIPTPVPDPIPNSYPVTSYRSIALSSNGSNGGSNGTVISYIRPSRVYSYGSNGSNGGHSILTNPPPTVTYKYRVRTRVPVITTYGSQCGSSTVRQRTGVFGNTRVRTFTRK